MIECISVKLIIMRPIILIYFLCLLCALEQIYLYSIVYFQEIVIYWQKTLFSGDIIGYKLINSSDYIFIGVIVIKIKYLNLTKDCFKWYIDFLLLFCWGFFSYKSFLDQELRLKMHWRSIFVSYSMNECYGIFYIC